MYDLFYDLTNKPFAGDTDLDCFFLSNSHKRALVHLRYGLNQKKGFLVLTGNSGIGKSKLLSFLEKELPNPGLSFVRLMVSKIHDNELLPELLNQLESQPTNCEKLAPIEQLKRYLLRNAESGRRSVLFIDEAHKLSDHTLIQLNSLLEMEYNNQPIIQILLSGDPELNDRMSSTDDRQLQNNIVLSYFVAPLKEKEIRRYIQCRLRCVGWKGKPYFDEAIFEKLYNVSKGIPGKINECCDRLLRYGVVHEKYAFAISDFNLALSQYSFSTDNSWSRVDNQANDEYIDSQSSITGMWRLINVRINGITTLFSPSKGLNENSSNNTRSLLFLVLTSYLISVLLVVMFTD